MKIYVIRHGLTALNKRGVPNGEVDEPLVKEGLAQARAAAGLVPTSVRHVYSSPLQRAVQTAKLAAPSLPLVISNDLSEIKMGSLAGTAWEDMPSGDKMKSLHRSVEFDYRPYGGESVEEVVGRLRNFFADIHQKHQDGEVLVFTHGGVIRVLRFLENGKATYETTGNTDLLIIDSAKILGSTESR